MFYVYSSPIWIELCMFLFYQAIAPFSKEMVFDVPQLFCVFRWRDFWSAVITLQQEKPPRHLHRCYPMWRLWLHDESNHMWEECHCKDCCTSWWAAVLLEDRWRCTHEDVWRCNIYWWQYHGTEITFFGGPCCHMTRTLFVSILFLEVVAVAYGTDTTFSYIVFTKMFADVISIYGNTLKEKFLFLRTWLSHMTLTLFTSDTLRHKILIRCGYELDVYRFNIYWWQHLDTLTLYLFQIH